MLSKLRRTSLVDNIAKQKITLFHERFWSFSIYFCSTAETSQSVSSIPADWPNHSGSELPRGQFLDCHQVPENCHVRLCVSSDLWVLDSSISLTSHFSFTEAVDKGCSIWFNLHCKHNWSYKVFNLTEIFQKYCSWAADFRRSFCINSQFGQVLVKFSFIFLIFLSGPKHIDRLCSYFPHCSGLGCPDIA